MSERQGTSDGLCGVYAVCHILASDPICADHDKAFKSILKHFELAGLLTAERVADTGYSANMLSKAFNSLPARRRAAYEAITIPRFRLRYPKPASQLDKWFEQGLRLVLTEDGPGHWLAITGKKDGSLKCFDPYPSDRTNKMDLKKLKSENGLVIMPNALRNEF